MATRSGMPSYVDVYIDVDVVVASKVGNYMHMHTVVASRIDIYVCMCIVVAKGVTSTEPWLWCSHCEKRSM